MIRSLKSYINRRIISPLLVRSGWRPSLSLPIEETYLGCQLGFDEEEAIKDAVRKVNGHTMASFERLASLWQQVRYLDRCGVAGSLVECGVWKGGSTAMMALAHLSSAWPPHREIHLFDSFEGLPEPEAGLDGRAAAEFSRGRAGGAMKPIERCVGTLQENKNLLEGRVQYPPELLRYHAGWFKVSVPADAAGVGPIALLRLDGDWYQSTKICLENLYPHVVEGGIVVIDDYGYWQGCRKAVDEFLARVQEPVFLSHIDYTGRFWIRVRR